MAYRYRSRSSWNARTRIAHRSRAHRDHGWVVPMLLFGAGIPLIIGTVAMAIVGIVALAGGMDPAYVEPRYPKPDGYRFHEWRLEAATTLCVDPGDGPDTQWSHLALAQDVVARWKDAAPSLPLEVIGVCDTAGDDADGRIKWERLDGLWGVARTPEMDISLNPEITPTSWECVGDVLAHEVGHLVGLDHQPDDVPSVMNPGGCDDSITAIDIAAIRFLYEGRRRP